MEPLDVIRDIEQTCTVLQPWRVVVQEGRVVRIFDHAGTAVSGDQIIRPGDATTYEVDARLPHPPGPGSPVDPTSLGWIAAPPCG